jgi:hypothetical protein
LDFSEQVHRDYSIIFDNKDSGNDNAIATESFSEKWGWFGVMHRLCKEDISKLDMVSKINLFEALTWLTYETDLESQNKVKLNERKQQNL